MEVRRVSSTYVSLAALPDGAASFGYKQTDAGVIPIAWDSMPLADLCIKIQDGTHFSPKIKGHDYLYLTSKNIRFGFLDISTADYIDADQHEAIYRRCDVKQGDLLLTKDGANTGNAALNTLSEQFSLLSSVAFLRFDIKKYCAGYFLQQVLSTQGQRRMKDVMSGNAITRLTLEKIRKLIYPVAPLPEQEAIAEALSDADALIESLQQLIAKKRQVKQGTMQALLTGKQRLRGFAAEWVSEPLGGLVSMYQPATISARQLTESGFPVYGANGVVGFYDKSNHNKWQVTVTCRGSTCGTVNRTVDRCWITGNAMVMNCDDNPAVDKEFFYHLLSNQDLSMCITGTGQPQIVRAPLTAFHVPMPPSTAEQTAIAIILTDMDTELAALEARLAKTHQLKQGMMQELLTGRIRLVRSVSTVVPLSAKRKATQSSTIKPHNQQINEAVVIAALTKHFGSEDWPLARVRRTKLAYLLHRHAEGRAEGFLKKAAGPYDPRTRYKGPEGIALKKGYVRTRHNGKYQGFVASENIAEAEAYFEKWYGADVMAWLEQFHRRKIEELELLTTVDMAVEDLRREGKSISVDAVKRLIHDDAEWRPKLDRAIFSDTGIADALAECQTLFAP